MDSSFGGRPESDATGVFAKHLSRIVLIPAGTPDMETSDEQSSKHDFPNTVIPLLGPQFGETRDAHL